MHDKQYALFVTQILVCTPIYITLHLEASANLQVQKMDENQGERQPFKCYFCNCLVENDTPEVSKLKLLGTRMSL